MEQQDEMDYFKVLEEKVGVLIAQITSLKEERESLREKIQQQERNILDFTREIENLKSNRDKARERIVSILEKIEQMGI